MKLDAGSEQGVRPHAKTVAFVFGVGILPRTQTLEAKHVFVGRKRAGNVQGEEHWRDLADNGASLLQKRTGTLATGEICHDFEVSTMGWSVFAQTGSVVAKDPCLAKGGETWGRPFSYSLPTWSALRSRRGRDIL